MTIKKISKLLFVAAFGLVMFPACTDLEVEGLDSEITDVSAGGSGSIDPAELLISAYNDLGIFPDQANTYSLYAHTSDLMIPPTRGTDWGDNGIWRTLHAHTWDAGHSYVLNSWNQLNERIFKCNQIIETSGVSIEVESEARFLRAFYMWHVMDLWGQVPFRGSNDGVDVLPTVKTRAEAFDFIVTDLETALPNLQSIGPDANNSTASVAAAQSMLSRLYLNKEVYTGSADYTKAIAASQAVMDEGFSLEDEYFKNFTADAANEIVFVSPAGGPLNRVGMTTHYDQQFPEYDFGGGGWNGMTTLAEFYDKFDATDERKGSVPDDDLGRGFLIGQQYLTPDVDGNIREVFNTRNNTPLSFKREVKLAGAETDEGIRVIKYHPKDMNKYILIRYAEIYLNHAEALMRSGDSDGALTMVNDLRAMRGISTPLATIDEATMLDERGRETYWEGYRRVDQIRFGTWGDPWNSKTNSDAHRVLFPIPQQALDSNPNLKQNDGY